MLAVVVTTLIGAVTALVSIILHYTNKGDDAFGCTSETLMMNGKFNTNKYCTREMAACNFLPKYLNKTDKSSAAIGCAEAVSFEIITNDHCLQIQGHCKMDSDCPDIVISSHPRHVLVASMAAKKDSSKTNKRRRETAHACIPVSGFPSETTSQNQHRAASCSNITIL